MEAEIKAAHYVLLIFYSVFSYFVGGIPVGYLIARWRGIADIREHGSGGTGATNVARHLGPFYFFLVFALDAGKAYGALAVGSLVLPRALLPLCALSLMQGNIRTPFLSSKKGSGKGVATLLGITLFMHPICASWMIGIWAVVAVLTRTVGVASVVASASLPVLLVVYRVPLSDGILFFLLVMLVISRHRDNIKTFLHKRSHS